MFWEQHLIIRQNYNSEGTGATHLPLYFTHQTLNIHWKDRCWSSNTLATWFEEPAHSKRPWCRERSRARGGGGSRRWDGQIASLTQRLWIWANSRRQWKTGQGTGRAAIYGAAKSHRHSDWTTTIWRYSLPEEHEATGGAGLRVSQWIEGTEHQEKTRRKVKKSGEDINVWGLKYPLGATTNWRKNLKLPRHQSSELWMIYSRLHLIQIIIKNTILPSIIRF